MANDSDVVLTLRVPKSMADRVERVREWIVDEREFALKSRISRSDALRLLILRGLEHVEEQYADMIFETDEKSNAAE